MSTRNLVEVEAHPQGVNLILTSYDEPISQTTAVTMSHLIDKDAADRLYHDMREVYLLSLGLEAVQVPAHRLEREDIIESIGCRVRSVEDMPSLGKAMIWFMGMDELYHLYVPRNLELRVNRIIR